MTLAYLSRLCRPQAAAGPAVAVVKAAAGGQTDGLAGRQAGWLAGCPSGSRTGGKGARQLGSRQLELAHPGGDELARAAHYKAALAGKRPCLSLAPLAARSMAASERASIELALEPAGRPASVLGRRKGKTIGS